MIEGLEMLQADAGAVIAFALVLAAIVGLRRAVRAARDRRRRVFDGSATARLKAMVETRRRSLRSYFFATEAEPAPFDRATRAWVYRIADPEHGDTALGAGPPQDDRQPGAILFALPRKPLGDWESRSTPPLAVGDGWCDVPFLARSVVNIGGMGYGAISRPAVQALARGAALAGCWLDTGDGGVTPYHLEGDCDLVMQLTAARHGLRDADGPLLPARARKLARKVKAFEIKLTRGNAPAAAGRHREAPDITEVLDHVVTTRALTGRPVGIKVAIDGGWLLNELVEDVLRRGLEYAPDFLVIDGGDAPTSRPQAAEPAALAIEEALPRAADVLIEAGLKERVRLVASGKLVTARRAAWALSSGADFVTSARGFMFALGCMQALRCESNTCPTGITSHDPALQRALVVDEKYLRVANYAMGMNYAIDAIAHECGLAHARLLRREHCRVVQPAGSAIALDALHPYPRSKSTAAVPLAAVHLAE